jgi:hypothetical protein
LLDPLESNPNNPTAPVTLPIREHHMMADAPEITPGGPVEVLLPKGCVPHTYKQLPPLRRADSSSAPMTP